ncbi:type II toxin-antitoxin system CcdA family antitoxin [Enterobacter cloacae]|uniref:type II toxin-antitoxin system CcdA family antitoxin n=1 Tax=Enterobacter cloacae TaxID=550 RepID=UPI001BDDCB83|nr:type II toxin-antitoxin system CcdA family antitoxin [Enterobacter cloacae]MBT1836451.1 type II toxin-antitoxin system CcdA family antitoxin [Enterobacter cloacae]HBL4999686.1 type II toxin-antitoxin system CcdA family antitoxin [Enterobacter cloacae]
MLVYYATLRQFMRIPMGGLMRTTHGIKKSVNVSLAPEILEEARRLKLNLSAVLTTALQEQFRAHQRTEWLAENKASIEAINQWVDENGSFSDFQRSF